MSDPVTRLNAALEGRYTIERELGEGGMATVYLADDLKHDRKVALKVLKPELAALVGAERFLTEIKTTANLQHPHILALFDSGEADGAVFYVMPNVEGESLRDKLDREKQLGVKDSVAIIRKVADALDYAHERGVVHRDIKPGNILLSERGEPLVADFGIALAVAQAGAGRITETGLSLGTPHYMSPEQATGDRDVDPRSDVFALACVLYEMLAGEPPFSAPTAQAVLVRILTTEAPSITSVRRTVEPNVAAALTQALEKLPADRFASAAEFGAALGDEGFTYRSRPETATMGQTATTVATPESIAAPAPVAAARPWHRDRRFVAALLGAAAMTAVAAWGWLSRPPPPEPGVPTRPDGRWIAYQSDESGEYRVYVHTFPTITGRRSISPGLGTDPVWSPDGRELYYRSGSQFLVVDVTTEPTFDVSVPELLFDEVAYIGSAFLGAFRNWDVHPDGSRFLMVRQGGGGQGGGGQGGGGLGGGGNAGGGSASAFNEVYLVTNWFEELRQRMGN